jgi:molybdate transport system substrate-binding protein
MNKSNLISIILGVFLLLALVLPGCASPITTETTTLTTTAPAITTTASTTITTTAPAVTSTASTTVTNTAPTITTTKSTTITTTATTSVTTATTITTTVTATTIKTPITLNVSAAASLTDVLKEINNLYVKVNPHVTITPNFTSSGTLQTQIQNGAPVDVFLSAAASNMDTLQNQQLILNETRKNLLNNKIVLIVPLNSILSITSLKDLTNSNVKQIAIGDPKSVPAGAYAQQAFDQLGITDQLKPKCVLGASVRDVLTYVESGNVDAGIVYSTDVLTSIKVKVVASAPDDINALVVYPVAVIKASKIPDDAKEYINFLFSAQAKAVFEKYGFSIAIK